MTMDDGNSVYVGGLPYDATEDTLRRIFSVFGSVAAVKIVNDRSVRGKCFGFVTFTNRHSADDAINGMDGKTIGGRVVRVNEVTSRGGRLNPSREWFQHGDQDRGRDREREYRHDRDPYGDGYGDRSRGRNGSRERDRSREYNRRELNRYKAQYADKERGYEHPHNLDRANTHALDRDQDEERNLKDNEGEHHGGHEYYREREHNLSGDQQRGIDGTSDYCGSEDREKDQDSRRENGEHFLSSREDYSYQAKEQLEGAIKRHEELRKEVVEMKERLDEKEKLVLDLQKRSKKLEDALISAKRRTSQHRKQLTKLHKAFLQVRECTNKLKSFEHELQYLVDATMREAHNSSDFGTKDEIVANGFV